MALTTLGLLAAGCGGASLAGAHLAAAGAPPGLATSLASAGGTSWAVVDMGGSSAARENFWQLFARPARSPAWRQATPAGVADNGGLVVAAPGGTSLVTGFRPSHDLTFSPLAVTTDDGAHWATGTLVGHGLADLPGALAAGAAGRLIALTGDGEAQLGTRLGAVWTNLASVASLARTGAGKACGLTGLTAVAFGAARSPLLGGRCARPGVPGLFALRGHVWLGGGPALPAPLARQDVGVLALDTAGGRTGVVLLAGAGPAASVLVATSSARAGHWRLSPPLRVGRAGVTSVSFGAAGGVGLVLPGGHGEILSGAGGRWDALPALPAATATLALGPAARVDALAARGTTFTDWRLSPNAAWTQAQTLHVPIPYGSSS